MRKHFLSNIFHSSEAEASANLTASLEDFLTEKRAPLTRRLLLILMGMTAFAVVLRLRAGLSVSLDLTMLAALSVSYLTTKTRYYYTGALFLILSMCFAGYFSALQAFNRGDAHPEIALIWLVLPMLIMPLLLPWRIMVVTAPIPLLFFFAFIYNHAIDNLGAMSAVLSTGALILIFIAYSYDSDLKLIHSQNLRLQEQNQKLIKSYNESLRGWTIMLEMRDKETEGHSERVTELSMDIARYIGITDEKQLQIIQYGSMLHDIGKIAIPDFILHKPGPLNEVEWQVMEMHTEFAYQWLKDIEFLQPALDIPRFHHEKWDGSGYNRMKGEEIPLFARIFSIADCYDALTHDRAYRLAWPPERALDYITENAGKEFDPAIVSAFLKLMSSGGYAQHLKEKNQ